MDFVLMLSIDLTPISVPPAPASAHQDLLVNQLPELAVHPHEQHDQLHQQRPLLQLASRASLQLLQTLVRCGRRCASGRGWGIAQIVVVVVVVIVVVMLQFNRIDGIWLGAGILGGVAF